MLAPTTIVMLDVPDPGAGIVVGLKLTVVPEGTPEADKAMELSNPPLTAVVTVEVPWFPWATVSELGDAESVKFPVTLAGRKAAIKSVQVSVGQV